MACYLGFRPSDNPKYYFLSYNSEDADRVGEMAGKISRAGIELWYDKGIEYGEKWEKTIAEKICGCQAVVLFFTRGILYKENSYVEKEYKMALKFSKKIYVVMMDDIDDEDVPPVRMPWWTDIQDLQCIEANIIADPDRVVEEIISALTAKMEQDTGNAWNDGINTELRYNYRETHKKKRKVIFLSVFITAFLAIVPLVYWGWTVTHKETSDEKVDTSKSDEAIEDVESEKLEEEQPKQDISAQSEINEIENNANIDWSVVAEARTVVVGLFLENTYGNLTPFTTASGFLVDKDTVITTANAIECNDFFIQGYNETHTDQISRDELQLKVISPDDFTCDASEKVIDVENNIALLTIHGSNEVFSSSDIFPKFRSTLPVTGEKLSLLGYTTFHDEYETYGNFTYKKVSLQGTTYNDQNMNGSKTKTFFLKTTLPDDDSINGTAGGPVIDKDGYIIGIMEATLTYGEGEEMLSIISTNEIKKILQN